MTDPSKDVLGDIALSMIARRHREVLVSLKALTMMQEHYRNDKLSFLCLRKEEEAEWYAKAEKIVPPVED